MTVIMGKPHPTLPPCYRPTGGIPYRVQNGDNWWSVAAKVGMPVTSLIGFNYHTTEPKYVNYYLKHNVGCKAVSADGKNYSFRDASPGIIYVPGPGSNFVWAAEPSKPLSPDDEYATLELGGKAVDVRDVTEVFGREMARLLTKVARLLRSDGRTLLSFPRLHLPVLKGYSPSDYVDIAGRIRLNGIEVYETRLDTDDLGFHAQYRSWNELNFFIVTPSVTATPLLYMNTIVHETTHAIQDRNKWRMSRLDNEVDTHFAEALYLSHIGDKTDAKVDLIMTRFLIAAKEYNDDARYLTSINFRNLRREMRNDVAQHYYFMESLFGITDLDAEEWHKNFRRKKRMWNGIPE